MKKLTILAAVFAALALSAGNASAADAAKGKKVYNKCKACHALKAGKNKVGPTLHGLFGRKAATVPNFKYSKAMKTSGVTWDEESLRAYLKKPRKFIKGTRMAFAGIKKINQMDDLLAYLKEATK
ncbi:MAG: cytochrome c family protein [Pseudomonadota bacterium]|nr:cytochrome c family protein [Pseudomonadota bacterium]